jgi:hypothetical protein
MIYESVRVKPKQERQLTATEGFHLLVTHTGFLLGGCLEQCLLGCLAIRGLLLRRTCVSG